MRFSGSFYCRLIGWPMARPFQFLSLVALPLVGTPALATPRPHPRVGTSTRAFSQPSSRRRVEPPDKVRSRAVEVEAVSDPTGSHRSSPIGQGDADSMPSPTQKGEASDTPPASSVSLSRSAPEEGAAKMTYRFVGRKASIPYNIILGHRGDKSVLASCITPCTRTLSPGPVELTVTGPGTKQFMTEMVLPEQIAEIRVQHQTTNRIIAGSILLGLGIGLSIAGSMGMASWATATTSDLPPLLASYSKWPLFGLSVAGLVHGGVFLFSGIGVLGATRKNHVELRPILDFPAAKQALQLPASEGSEKADRTEHGSGGRSTF